MRIESVRAHAFGPFIDRSLELAPGMTVICGPNESGKSQWHAALYAALCGMRRGRGRRTEDTDFVERHHPWDTANWEVSAIVALEDGRRVELRHDLDGRAGKLPVSFPRSVGQEPLYYNRKNTGRPSNDQHVTYSGYTDVSKEALFPFGYGLSYTTFNYSNLKLSSTSFNGDKPFYATVEVLNSGDRTGKEVVQLYIRDLVASRTRPIKELKDFDLITLDPGETKTVQFEITRETLEFYSVNNKWEAEPGDFKIFVGGDSRTTLEASFNLK